MRRLVVCDEEKYISLCKRTSMSGDMEFFSSADIKAGKLRDYNMDELITFDLAGFDQTTLTDNISYNLFGGRQIHLLLNKELPEEKVLANTLSIAMFFFVADDSYFEYLIHQYPRLPYIKKIEGWQLGNDENVQMVNANIISEIIDEIDREYDKFIR